jgi:hypothetical protein
MSPSLLQVFAVSDTHAQELIVGLLGGISDLDVHAERRGPSRLVTVACGDAAQARWVRRLVESIDFDAHLVHSSHWTPPEPLAA